MEFKQLDKKAKSYWALTSYIFAILFLAVALIVVLLVNDEFKLVLILSVGLPLFLLSVFLMIYPFLKYHFYGYNYDGERVVIKYGVIFKHVIVIPICQIQDLHIYQGPIMALFKLNGVIFSTAGSNFELRCLDKEVAIKVISDVEVFLKKRLEDLANEKIQ